MISGQWLPTPATRPTAPASSFGFSIQDRGSGPSAPRSVARRAGPPKFTAWVPRFVLRSAPTPCSVSERHELSAAPAATLGGPRAQRIRALLPLGGAVHTAGF